MNTLLIAAVSLLVIATIVILAVKSKKAAKVNQLAEDKKDLAKLYKSTKSTFFKLTANKGRIIGSIVDHQIVWVGPSVNNVCSMSQPTTAKLMQAMQLEPDEIAELKLIEDALAEVRGFETTEVAVVAEARVVHKYPTLTVTQYLAGTHKVGSGHKMRITISVNADHTVQIDKVSMSINFLEEGGIDYYWQDERYRAMFEKEYGDGGGGGSKKLFDMYSDERNTLSIIEKNIKEFNEHIDFFDIDPVTHVVKAFRIPERLLATAIPAEQKKETLVDQDSKLRPVS